MCVCVCGGHILSETGPQLMVLTQIAQLKILLLAIWNKKCRPPCPVNQNPRNVSITSHSVDRQRVYLFGIHVSSSTGGTG